MKFLFILISILFSQISLASDLKIVDQDNSDVTVLRAFAREDLAVGNLVNVNRCDVPSSVTRYNSEYKSYNCAWELANSMNGTPVNPSFLVRTINGRMEDMFAQTTVVEIHTLIALDVFEKMNEIGFSLSNWGGTIHKYQKNQTREIQKVRMKDGRVGLVHRFVMPFVPTGGTTNCTIRAVSFKPFVTFVDPNSNTEYRNWDNFKGRGYFTDYFVTNFNSRTYQCQTPNRVDRSSDLLW